jgi:hypothetical protein
MYRELDVPEISDAEIEALRIIGPIGPMTGHDLKSILELVRRAKDIPAWKLRYDLVMTHQINSIFPSKIKGD